MLFDRLFRHFREQDWVILISELVVVVAGIFMALQVDSWQKAQRDLADEQIYLLRLTDDIESDITSIERSIGIARFRLELGDVLLDVADNSFDLSERPLDFMVAVHQAAFTATPSLRSDTFEELRSTGRIGLLRDNTLKSDLFEYYRFNMTERQYLPLQLMTEFKHFELAAGVLTNKQNVWLQDNVGIVWRDKLATIDQSEIDVAAVVAAGKRLRENTALLAWLTEARNMQIELANTHTNRKTRAVALLGLLKAASLEKVE